MKRHYIVAKTLLACIFFLAGSLPSGMASSFLWKTSKVANESTITEGPVSSVVFTVGPFDLHRRYLSMEGPWVTGDYKAGDMLASKKIELPEGLVNYLENGSKPASMMGISAPSARKDNFTPIGLVHRTKGNRELYWFKGVKLEVLDENGVVQPTAEFICHWNLSIDPEFRNRIFTEGHPTANSRLSSISQGETVQMLPQGFGVPIASDETLQLSFQAANRTTDVHRRIKHRCTLYFIKDKDLYYPIKALYCQVPYITVITDKNAPQLSAEQKKFCPVCVGTSDGVDAPNDKIGGTWHDAAGRSLTGHWVIPPGIHTYRDVITAPRDTNFQKNNPIIRAAWTHVHPLCTKLSLIECVNDKRSPVLTTTCETKTKPGLQIMHLGFLTPKGGVQLHESSQYELEVTYNNPLPIAVDSMASMGIYMEDPTFARPRWALHDYKAEENSLSNTGAQDQMLMSCAIPQACNVSTTSSPKVSTPVDILQLPIFDKTKDGPLLTDIKTVRVDTNAGPITFHLNPNLAPFTATQIYKLLTSGAFIGTHIFRYEPGFVLQVANVENKVAGNPNDQLKPFIRRMPLEVSQQKYGQLNHRPHVLSLGRYDDDKDSGTTSFSILLGNAPQLDHKYTIFGNIGEDAATLETLDKIENNWNPDQYWITGAKVIEKIASINN